MFSPENTELINTYSNSNKFRSNNSLIFKSNSNKFLVDLTTELVITTTTPKIVLKNKKTIETSTISIIKSLGLPLKNLNSKNHSIIQVPKHKTPLTSNLLTTITKTKSTLLFDNKNEENISQETDRTTKKQLKLKSLNLKPKKINTDDKSLENNLKMQNKIIEIEAPNQLEFTDNNKLKSKETEFYKSNFEQIVKKHKKIKTNKSDILNEDNEEIINQTFDNIKSNEIDETTVKIYKNYSNDKKLEISDKNDSNETNEINIDNDDSEEEKEKQIPDSTDIEVIFFFYIYYYSFIIVF